MNPQTNRTLFHAAFVRDPIERALSAFLDKCVRSQWVHRYWCKPQSSRKYGIYSMFDLFVENVVAKPPTPVGDFKKRNSYWGMDYHWYPQNWICDIYKFIDNILRV